MKSHRLSSAGERICAILISVILILSMVLICWLLSTDVLSFVICILAAVLVSAGLLFYAANLMKAAVIFDGENHRLQIKGIPDFSVNIADTVSLETVGNKMGPVATRTLIFRDSGEEVVATVPTFFIANQGAQAEPMAMVLAEEMGITFKASLEPWEYDKELRKQHMKDLAEAEKQERKEKMRALKNKILRREEPAEADPVSPEEEDLNCEPVATEGVNYDAMDDEK